MKHFKMTLGCILMLLFSTVVYAQNRITGKITDASGELIIGASVLVKGTTNGTITDLDGQFTLNNASGTLVISYIGYVTQEITIGNRTIFNVILIEDAELLDEVIVVGYGTQRKASLTSAISQVRGEEVFKDRGINNVSLALQGEIPGLVVTRSSTRPGSEGVAMKIRGDISVNGNSSPLVLIDGMPGSLDELNQMEPNDIENISVLKDASAAIYGARSASGVILITTKRGKKGAAKITYNGSFSTTIDGIRPSFTNNEQWLDMWYEAQYRDAEARFPNLKGQPSELMKQFDWWIFGSSLGGQDIDSGDTVHREELWNRVRNGEEFTLINGTKTIHYQPGNYMMDDYYGQATWHKHSVSVSGGDDRFGYMASLGFADSQSQLKLADDGERKYSARLNMDYQATRALKIEAGMSFEKRNIASPSTDVGAGWTDPWFWPWYTPKGNFYDTFSGNRNPVGGLVGGGEVKTGFTTSRMNMKAILDLSRFVQGLSLTGNGSYKSVRRNTQTSKIRVQYYDWADNITGNKQSPGSLSEQLSEWESSTLSIQANYQRSFSKVHNVSAMVAMSAEEERNKSVTASRNSGPLYAGSGLTDLNVMISGTNNGASGGQSEWAFLSYLTRLSYSYADKYLIEFLGRRDGSSKLYPDQRFKNFYSASGGWVLSQENFMQSFSWLNFLKVRYNYGKTGSIEGIGNYERFATIGTGTSWFGTTSLSSQPSLSLSGMTSSDRTWETIISHNAGLDFTLLKNRLSGTLDLFWKTNNGMFIPITYPAILGATAPKTNNGKFGVNGWEFSLNWRDKIGNLKYNIGGYVSDSKAKVLELENNENVPNAGKNSNRLIGMPRDAIYVYNTNGIFQTQEEADAYYEKYYWADAAHSGPKPNNILPAPATTGTNRLRPGARKLVDTNGDGAITQDDLVYAGDAAPHITFGIKAGLEWKGIDFQAFFQGVGKQVVLRGGNIFGPWVTNYTMQNALYYGKLWGDTPVPYPVPREDADGNAIYDKVFFEANPDSEFTVASRDNNFNRFNYQNKDVSVQRSRYIRLKSLIVGYTLPQTWTQKAGISKLRFYFSGDDLWEWTRISDGFDPEHGEQTNTTFPFSRLISFGLDVTF